MIFSILFLVILIFLNGIFSASELAFLSLDKVELKNEVKNGNKKAIKMEKILNNPSTFLSTIQIGITLVGFFASAFAADYFADYFMGIINISFLSEAVLRALLVFVITIILSYFTLVFGELVPKKVAINKSFEIASTFVNLIGVVNILFYPLIKLLTWSTEVICKILRIKDNPDKLTEEDIKKMIILGQDEGIVEEKEKEYILNIFNFNDIDLRKVMTPMKDVVALDINNTLVDNMSIMKENKYSRYPVYDGDINNIIGILHVKDIIMQHSDGSEIDFRALVRPVTRFQLNKKIDDVFRYMQENNESVCVVYKKDLFVGLITVEDAVEEIVGNIYDEYDNK